MNNLEILRQRNTLVDELWQYIVSVKSLPLVIIARRQDQISVNIKIASKDLSKLWEVSGTSQTLPLNFQNLASRSQDLVVDVTALFQHSDSVRVYAYAQDFSNFSSVKSLWPNVDQNTHLLGLYSDRQDYKLYQREDSSLVKYTYSQESVSQQSETWVESLDLAQFGLDQLNFDLRGLNFIQRQDLTAVYVTVWNHVDTIKHQDIIVSEDR